MKLKTLLLGSAAAMIAVTGARAADAVIAEPEPVEYVRVCDMYGSGFFYIPGTETCIAFSGYVRTDYTYNANQDNFDIDGDGDLDDLDSDRFDYRARFNIDVRNETDYGTLRSQIRFQADGNGGGDGAVGIDRALISLAGFRLGYSDTWNTTFHGYGNPVEKYDGYYGYDQAIFLDYTYAANGFEAAIGLQGSRGDGDIFVAGGVDRFVEFDYYGGLAYGGSWGRLAGSLQYETNMDVLAWKVSAELTLIENLTVKGWYIGDDGDNSRLVEGPGDYAWGVGANYNITDTFAARAAFTDADGLENYFTVGLKWDPVPGLSIRPEVQLREDTGESYSVRVYRTF